MKYVFFFWIGSFNKHLKRDLYHESIANEFTIELEPTIDMKTIIGVTCGQILVLEAISSILYPIICVQICEDISLASNNRWFNGLVIHSAIMK